MKIRRMRFGLVALFLAWFPTALPAHAQDGGTRSPFASGAGPRALGMGSAFVGVADDASALMWNPGGIGIVQRREFQASQASFFGLDITESYAAFVWPDWRWGAVAASIRHFGVGGLERRDERNLLIDDNLSDSQTEIAIGYGRALGDLWSIGGLIKARRQSLAGLSGSGFGLDLGVNVQPGAVFGDQMEWTRNLSWGLAISNLVEPGIRLVRETVDDPVALRTGFAYRHLMFGFRSMIVSVDFERARASGTKFRAGLEVNLHPNLDMRWGTHDGMLTAGTGIHWRDLTLDYVFEDNPIDVAHRFGVSWSFGLPVREAQAQALQAEEEAIQNRLAEAFLARQEEQVKTLIGRARDRLAENHFDDALEALSGVAVLQPGNAEATRLETEIVRAKARDLEAKEAFADAAIQYARVLALNPGDTASVAARQRCEEESARRAAQSEEIRSLFADAVENLAGDQLGHAREGFRSVLEADPENEEAQRMLKRVDDAIRRRAAEIVATAHQSIRANRFTEAERWIAEAAALDRNASGLGEARSALERARQAATRPAPTPAPSTTVAQPVSRESEPQKPKLKPKEIETLYRRGLDAMEERRADDALRYFELVWSADPEHVQAGRHLKREYLMRGMESFAAGRLDDAVQLWEKALRVDPNDARTKGYLERARKQLARTREILGGGR